MSGTVTAEENEMVSRLKKQGVLKRFQPETELGGVAKNGGVAVICSDGDIDAEPFHRRISARPHAIKLFGGPLILAPRFGGYNHTLAYEIMKNIKQGMAVKKTRTLYLYFHAPCGMAAEHKHDLSEVLEMAKSVYQRFRDDGSFARVFLLFHVKRVNRAGNLEENTYIINVGE